MKMSEITPSSSAIMPMPETARDAALPVTPARPATGLLAFALASATLWQREVIRFLRQRSRVIGALMSPVIFWVLIGSGLGTSFQPEGASSSAHYLSYFFPGTLILILLFTSIFSTISLIEDRREGFLQGVLVSPVPRGSLVLGKVLGGTTLAVLQALVFLLLAPFVGLVISPATGLLLIGSLALVAFGLTSLGFVLAWRSESTQGYHAMMNVLLFPMWLLSGALFPPSGAAGWVQTAMSVNPLSYGLALVRRTLADGEGAGTAGQPELVLSLGVTVGFAAVMFGVAWAVAARPRKHPLI